ncbi:hypothetical protein MaudCBS49596_001243 [Microsporum audouinii]
MRNTETSPISYRIRRCALIPKGINLTLEEEMMVIKRIGYRPIPPPGAMTSNWFTRHAEVNISKAKACGAGKQEVAMVGIPAGRYRAGSECSETLANQRMVNARLQVNGAFPQNDTFTSSIPSRLQRDLWNVDIPHMSEIKPLDTLSPTAGLSPFPHKYTLKEAHFL